MANDAAAKNLPATKEETRPTYTYRNPQSGLYETMDALTGEVLAVQQSKDDFFKTKEQSLIQIMMPDGRRVWCEKHISADRIPHKLRHWVYSETIGDVIAQLIAEGGKISKVSDEHAGIPPYTIICKWRREHESFKRKLVQAESDRADLLFDTIDEIIKEMDASIADDRVQKAKLKLEAIKTRSSVGNADKFGTKTKIVGDPSAPLMMVIDTGIRRPGDAGYNVDETAKIRQTQTRVVNDIADPLAREED